MLKKVVMFIGSILCLGSLNAGLPTVKPAFKTDLSARIKPELKVFDVVIKGKNDTNPVLISGNKRIALKEQNQWNFKLAYSNRRPGMIAIIIDNKQAMLCRFWGYVVDTKVYGYAFNKDDKAKITVDKKNQSITFTKKYLITPDKSADYSYTLKILKDGKIKLSWDLGISTETLNAYKKRKFWFEPHFSVDLDYLKTGINYNNNAIKFLSKEAFKKTKLDKKHRLVTIAKGKGGTFTFAPNNPLKSFKLIFNKDDNITIKEGYNKYAHGHHHIKISIGNKIKSPTGYYIIDLGKCAVPGKNTPEVINGTDIWKVDRSHLPLASTKNIMPNPSFEQGMRYWKHYSLGGNFRKEQVAGKPLYEISNDAKFGDKALKVNSGAIPLNSFSIPVLVNKNYTVSYYAKAVKPNTYINFWAMTCIQAGKWLKEKRIAQKITQEWKRYSFVYKTNAKAITLALCSGNPIFIDAIQIEQGDKLTDFIAPKVEGNLISANPDNALKVGQKMDARFALNGDAGTKGKVQIDVFDYYREKVFSITDEFTLDNNGKKIIPLNFNPEKIGRGIFVVKATYSLAGKKDYFDFYRFSIIDPLKNTHATKNLFGTLPDFTRSTRSADLALRFQEWGWGSFGSGNLPVDYCEKYKFRKFYTRLSSASPHFSKETNPWYGIYRTWDKYTPERAKILEKMCYEAAKNLPNYKPIETAVSGEVECRQAMVRAGKYKDYIKLMLAARRGVKRANKNIIFLPDQGTSGFNPLRGYKETEAFLAAVPKGVKWDALATHPYGDIDMLDERTAYFIKLADKYGQGHAPLRYAECFNIADTWIPSWGATGAYDYYWNGRPTYDSGWAEFNQAAKAARVYITCLKHWPRLEHVNIWVNRPSFDEHLTPLMLCGAVNTLGHLFGNPKFKTDIRPVAGVRCYVFEDDKNQGVAAIWSNIALVEKGYEVAPKIKIKVANERPEIIDLMGNKRTYKVVNGGITIPLSPAPIFIRNKNVNQLIKITG